MKLRLIYLPFLFIALMTLLTPARAEALSFSLDSIAEWGRFPRFVVNTYRWGDRFFNGYDTTYVQGAGHKFSAKLTSESWVDGYHFELPNSKQITLISDPSTSAGVYLSYLAVSVGYDVNFSQIFEGKDLSRKRFRFGFNCMLFGAEAYLIRNDGGTVMRRCGDYNHLKVNFNGLTTKLWGIDTYYFFNHRKYSEAASFNFSRVQKRSQGSFYAGFSFYSQELDFNFSGLPEILREQLPEEWPDRRYEVNTKNYAIRAGYAYNWVFKPQWVLGVSASPIIGLRKGYVSYSDSDTSFSMYNRIKASVVWNSRNHRLFFGAVAKFDMSVVNDKRTTYTGGVLSGEAVFGVRFDLW